MKRRYAWIGNGYCTCFKTFKSYNEMIAWAIDKRHEGTYYISCQNITFRMSREQIIQDDNTNF